MIVRMMYKSNTCVPAPAGSVANWLDVTSPTEAEFTKLHETYDIPLDFLTAVLDKNERPRLEQEKHTTLVLIRASQGKKQPEGYLFTTTPIAVIITPDIVITVCEKHNLVLKMILARELKKVHARPHLLIAFSLLKRVSSTFITDIHLMDAQTELTEQTLRKSMRNEELINLLHMEKSLIYFITALRSNLAVVEQFNSHNSLELKHSEKSLLSTAIIENKQAADMAAIFSEVLGSLGDTFGSIVSNNLNKVMKFLTGMTIVLMVPSILGSYYGMNVPLPFADYPHAFFYIMVTSLTVSLLIWFFLWKKDWM